MPKTSYLDRKNRIDRLVGLLKSEGAWTAIALSKTLRVSLRTLMRDLRDLEAAGYPIESDRGRGGGIRLHHGWGLGKLQLSYAEILDLLVALATMEKLPSPLLMKNLRSVRHKIALSFPDSQRQLIASLRKRIFVGDRASDHVLSNFKTPIESVLGPLQQGFFENKQLKISYIDERKNKTARTIEPHFLLFNWPVWYVLAWDHSRSDIRFFRVDRIVKCGITKEPFLQRDQIKLNKSIADFFESV